MRILSLPLAAGVLKTLFPVLSILLLFFSHLAKALDKTIEVCPLE